MPFVRPIFTNFTSGELTPRLLGREDITRYENGCSIIENFIIHPHGGAARRSGTQFIAKVERIDKKDAEPPLVRLIPFQFSKHDNYVLEFSEYRIRFFRNRGQVLVSANGKVLSIVSAFTAEQAQTLQYVQSADELYLVHPEVAPQKLVRAETRHTQDGDVSSIVTWTMAPIPFIGINLDGTQKESKNRKISGAKKGYPAAIAFFEQRLCLAGFAQQPQTIIMSKSADFFNFTLGDKADEGIEYTISTDQVNHIRWMRTGRVLLIGSSGGEFVLQGSTSSEPVSPDNISVRRESTFGSEPVMPLYASSAVLYVQRGGRRLRELAFSLEADGFRAEDLTLLADHISHSGLQELAYTQVPDSVVWAVRGDGVLLGLSYEKTQKIICWHRHQIAQGKVESITVIPSPDGRFDDLWLVVRREINGMVERYIEFMHPLFDDEPIDKTFQVDSGIVYEGEKTTAISGLDHLEGENVDIVADGAPRARQSVKKGKITLNPQAAKVQIGLPYTSRLETLPLIRGAQLGTAMGVQKRISLVRVRLLRSIGGKVGTRLDRVDGLPAYRQTYGTSLQPFTGDRRITLPSGWETGGRLAIVQDQPLPFTLLAIVPDTQISG